MKNFSCGAILCTLFLLSCTPSERSVAISNVDCTGELSKYIGVADGDYKFREVDGKTLITIKVKLTNLLPSNITPLANSIYNAELMPIDEQGNELSTDCKFKCEDSSPLEALLKNTETGATNSITFERYNHSSQETKNIMTKAVGFKVNFNKAVVLEDSKISVASSNSWDETLDQYEKYINAYVAAMKKAAKGGFDELAECQRILEQASDFGDKLQDAEGSMTSKQSARYVKLTKKLASSMSTL